MRPAHLQETFNLRRSLAFIGIVYNEHDLDTLVEVALQCAHRLKIDDKALTERAKTEAMVAVPNVGALPAWLVAALIGFLKGKRMEKPLSRGAVKRWLDDVIEDQKKQFVS